MSAGGAQTRVLLPDNKPDGLIEMNRLLLSALCMAALSAQAGTLATVPNSEGGLIRFTDLRCTADYPLRYGFDRYVTGTAANGESITGCWKWDSDDQTASVYWVEFGKIYTYESGAMTFTDYARRKADEREQREQRRATSTKRQGANL